MTGNSCSWRAVNNARMQRATRHSAAARDGIQASPVYRQAALPGDAPVPLPVFRQTLQGTGPGAQPRTHD
ncbi:MAG: hypothetical protein WBQ78_03915 [Gammaproteobacteria bacterium]